MFVFGLGVSFDDDLGDDLNDDLGDDPDDDPDDDLGVDDVSEDDFVKKYKPLLDILIEQQQSKINIYDNYLS